MAVFDYDESFQQAEYYELLNVLMEHWETEIVEFKEAKGGYSEDKIGQYFSAISNEANLKNQQYGWFVLGVSEEHTKHPVGTSFKKVILLSLKSSSMKFQNPQQMQCLFWTLLSWNRYIKGKNVEC